MKQVVFAIGFVLILAGSAAAQINSANSSIFLPNAMPSADAVSLTITPLPFASATTTYNTPTVTLSSAEPLLSPLNASSAMASSARLGDLEGTPQQDVQGVFQNFNWQAYLGYTYVRFYQVPGIELNTNGFNFGVVYYYKDWIGADGEFVATFGSQYGYNSKFLLGMGGARFRWSIPRGLELWAHGLSGGTHYLPQTANGNEGALAYELGGGVDINAGRRRWAYRLSADVVGTRYFNTYQFSPKFSAGIVFKF